MNGNVNVVKEQIAVNIENCLKISDENSNENCKKTLLESSSSDMVKTTDVVSNLQNIPKINVLSEENVKETLSDKNSTIENSFYIDTGISQGLIETYKNSNGDASEHNDKLKDSVEINSGSRNAHNINSNAHITESKYLADRVNSLNNVENNCDISFNSNSCQTSTEKEYPMESESKVDHVNEESRNVEESISINSKSDWFDMSKHSTKSKENDVKLISEKYKSFPDVLEIISDQEDDDCVVTEYTKTSKEIRPVRSSRQSFIILSDNGEEDESEVEEVLLDEDTKNVVELTNNTKGQSKNTLKFTAVQKNKFNILIKDTKVTSLVNNNISSKNAIGPLHLPSLTDDMFVIEVPSFIIPYVYEKPSVKPFREFVDKLGKDLEEQKFKEQKKVEKENKEAAGKKENSCQTLRLNEKEDNIEIKIKRGLSRKRHEDDDDSWDGGSSTSSEDETDDMDEIKEVGEILPGKIRTKQDSTFESPLGKFFTDIGVNLVQEYVQRDLLKEQNIKLRRNKRVGESINKTLAGIISIKKSLEKSKLENSSYKFDQIKCLQCDFKTESSIVMAHHFETPHMKNNIYKCNFCSFEVKSAHNILFHMEKEHNIKGKLERAPANHQCTSCSFEDNVKAKLSRHVVSCAKKFKPTLNLAPPLDWEPPAKMPKLNNIVIGTQRPRVKAPVRAPWIKVPSVREASIRSNRSNMTITDATMKRKQKQGSSTICEICDGIMRDLEQLRNHMQSFHQIKIHPKMINNRPPLNCQKCQARFFTDQGLERHLLGSHGLVTNSMQEAAKKGQDKGKCSLCGLVYQRQLLNHIRSIHNITLKPANLAYKCTLCMDTFGMYKQFESHVYSAHSIVEKTNVEKKKSVPNASKSSNNKNPNASTSSNNFISSLKISDKITTKPAAKGATKIVGKNK